jgi:Flp pilus assembly protein TadG
MTKTDVRARLFAQESGQILVMTAVTMVALLGIAALSLDVSFMYDKRNRLHAAADAAAKSAAIEVFRNAGASQANLEAFADQQVTAHGFSPARAGGTTVVTINHPPASGTFAGNDHYVEAIVSEDTSTFFARILGRTSMTPRATAVAGSGNPSNCLITKQDLSVGNSEIDTNGCGVAVGGNLTGTNPNAEIVGTPTPSVAVTGTCSGTCGAMGSLTTGAPPPTDPLAGLAAPANPGGCIAGVAAVLSPGCYTSIANTVKSLNPGIYYITGKIDIDNLSGTNVMLYLTGAGQLTTQNSNHSLTLTAPTTGVYKGIAIFQDPSDANDVDIKNNFALSVTGALYFPGADFTFKNSLSILNTTCTLFIGKSLAINNGNGSFTNSGCAGLYGGASFLTVSIAQ